MEIDIINDLYVCTNITVIDINHVIDNNQDSRLIQIKFPREKNEKGNPMD